MAKILLTYIGRRINGNNLHHFYKSENGENFIFGKKLGLFSIGAIIECELTENGVKKPYTYIQHNKSEDVDKWINSDIASLDEYNMLKISKKKKPTNYDNMVKNLKVLYKDLPYTQKQLFINRLIVDIVK